MVIFVVIVCTNRREVICLPVCLFVCVCLTYLSGVNDKHPVIIFNMGNTVFVNVFTYLYSMIAGQLYALSIAYLASEQILLLLRDGVSEEM